MSETKDAAVGPATPVVAIVPTAPQNPVSEHMLKFAKYINQADYGETSKKADYNEALVAYVADRLFAGMKLAIPSITADVTTIKLDTVAQYELLVLARVMYKSAMDGKISGDPDPAALAAHFVQSTMESNLWNWVSGVLTSAGGWEIQKMISPSDSVAAISKFYAEKDKDASATEFVEIALEHLITEICAMAVDLCSPEIDIMGKKSVTIDGALFNGILRHLNKRSSRPVATSFFVDLYFVSKQYPDTKKHWDKETKPKPAAKVPKEKKPKAGAKK